MDLDARQDVVDRGRADVEEPGGRGTEKNPFVLNSLYRHRAVDHVLDRDVAALAVMGREVHPDPPVERGFYDEPLFSHAYAHVPDALGAGVDGVGIAASRDAQHFDRERWIDDVVHPDDGGNAAHHAVRLRRHGKHPVSQSGRLDDGVIAHDADELRQERPRILADKGARALLRQAPGGLGNDSRECRLAEDRAAVAQGLGEHLVVAGKGIELVHDLVRQAAHGVTP